MAKGVMGARLRFVEYIYLSSSAVGDAAWTRG